MDGLSLIKLLADENRFRIVEILSEGEMNVTDIFSRLGKEQSLISHHLANMREQGILIARHSGKKVFYSLSVPSLVSFLNEANRLASIISKGPNEEISVFPESKKEKDKEEDFETKIERGED